ncbi:RraA family protein [Breznakiella homolactica]|uniref:Putative 4-hydroxy-4-methyl-2-oxoglutarate aldolase n=1 Tax=Breznakiella homolactica TaxID=2798577 RepID=A0A7T8B8H7_9SPIR|nr:RraA family protein [Breznakiella homolactica]QQO08614.1 RraA family protein [Breznakiella homolactica]
MKKIIGKRPELDQGILDKFAGLTNVMSVSCVVGDSMERDGIMHSCMKMRSVNKSFIGPAFTVKLSSGFLADCLEIFEHVKPGDVVVIDAFGDTETSIWGGLMSGLAKAAGVKGVVIYGSARDTDESRLLDFPIVSKSVSPREAHSAITKIFEPIELMTPVSCAGVIVNPGDIVVADEIGVSVVPYGQAEAVYEKAAKQAAQEEATRKEILKGATVAELLAKFGRI